jgi:hypothetical protein
MRRRTISGSSASAIAVEPAISEKRMVTVLRISGVAAAASGPPHDMQNRASGGDSAPHVLHRTMAASILTVAAGVDEAISALGRPASDIANGRWWVVRRRKSTSRCRRHRLREARSMLSRRSDLGSAAVLRTQSATTLVSASGHQGVERVEFHCVDLRDPGEIKVSGECDRTMAETPAHFMKVPACSKGVYGKGMSKVMQAKTR